VALVRAPTEDDVLPLTKPIVGVSGRVYAELPIPKGTPIAISTIGYNLCASFSLATTSSAEPYYCFATATGICGVQMLMCSDRNVGSKWVGKWNHPLGCMVTCTVTHGVPMVPSSINLSFTQLYVLRRR